jgi:hypothetical protein
MALQTVDIPTALDHLSAAFLRRDLRLLKITTSIADQSFRER